MRSPLGTNAGSQRSTVSSSMSLCSPTSCKTTVATNGLVMLPTRKRSRLCIGVLGFSAPWPLVRGGARARQRVSRSTGLSLERHGARTLHNLRARILQRLLALTACVYLNHWLGRPTRALVDYVA